MGSSRKTSCLPQGYERTSRSIHGGSAHAFRKNLQKHFEGSVNSETLITTLKHVQRQFSGKIILVWDRASIHTSKKTKTYLQNQPEILVEELPASAPQLNPEEYCHGNVKQRLKNAYPESKEEIRLMLDRGFARLRRRPDLLIGFFHTAGLSVRQLRLN